MKKILMTLAAACMAVTMNAQVYVGGSVGIASVKDGNADAETTYKFLPEVGYNINDEWAVGVTLGYQKGNCNLINASYNPNINYEKFSIAPYVRYTVPVGSNVNLFVDGGISYGSVKDNYTEFALGLKPGVAFTLSDKLSFVTHFGFVGFNSKNPKADGVDTSNATGVEFNQNNLTFGLYYNF
ncbi:MAG: porin family protein [Prevotella sp.]|nr:porin family protein [Prevotella sp.]